MHITVKNLNFLYSQKQVICDLSFDVLSGQLLLILGRNGSGKTTLIKCILGLLPVNPNSIFIDDVDITSKKYVADVGYISQKDEFNFEFPITGKELIQFAKTNKNSPYTVMDVAKRLGITDIINQNINTLSGGQLQKVFIGRVLINDPSLLVFDEPTVGIDSTSVVHFYQIIEELLKDGKTIILVTHEPSLALPLKPKILTLNENGEYKKQRYEEYLAERGDDIV